MKRRTGTLRPPVLIAGIVLALSFIACAGLFPWGERDDFIRVSGTHFMHNGKPYYFGGANFWYGAYLGSPGPTGDRGRLLRELDSLRACGLVNLRVLGASEASYIRRSVKPAIQRSPGVVDDSLLQGLDFLLAAMAERRMHAVLYLNNYWEWSGGMAQYNVWADTLAGVDPDDTSKPGTAFMDFSARFYSSPRANMLYRNYIRMLVTRRNTENGRLYDEDPTIMSWQLANEPRPGANNPKGEQNLPAYYRWIDETAAFIHSLDTNHLVSSGSEGIVAFRWSEECYLEAHSSKQINYLTVHVWPKNWGWFDPERYEETLPESEENARAYLLTHMSLARQLGRPIVLEEFGLARDSGVCAPGSPVTGRNRYFSMLLTLVEDSARAGNPFAGWNVWAWGGEARAIHSDYLWCPGDPFTGDPPQEPQGFNSVFTADYETLAIIREHAWAMMRLGVTDSLRSAAIP